jgi:hypothetical protein
MLAEKLRYARKKFSISGKLTICPGKFLHSCKIYDTRGKIVAYPEKLATSPPPHTRQQFSEKILIVVLFKTPARH